MIYSVPDTVRLPLRILIAASGTGGHLIPALLIARAFEKTGIDIKITFVGSGRPLEQKLIDGAGYTRHIIPIVGLKRRGISGALQFISLLPRAILSTLKIQQQVKPDLVIGVGGYASFFPVAISSILRKPTWIHEAELKPGLTNLLLSLFARKISLSFEDAKLPFWANGVFTGHPVKEEVVAVGQEPWEPQPPRKILIMGGSQGAQSIDSVMVSLIPWLKTNGAEIYHQARAENVELLKERYDEGGITNIVASFIDDIAAAYRWSDVIIARSGAGTVMEIGAVGRPAIFIPLPTAAGNEQAANAQTLVRAGKALLVTEGGDFQARLIAALDAVFDPVKYKELRLAARSTRSVNGASVIVEGALKLVGIKGVHNEQ